MGKRKIEIQRIETIHSEPPEAEPYSALDDPDERMLTLLSELDEARAETSRAGPRLVHALRQWANYVGQVNKDSVDMVDALLARVGVGEISDQALRALLARTSHPINSESTWRELEESSTDFYLKRAKMISAQTKVMNYIQYLEETQGLVTRDVTKTMFEAMEAADYLLPRRER